MSERVRITRTTNGYMGSSQQLNAELATATAKLSQWHMALSEPGRLESQLQLPDGRAIEARSDSVGTALVRVAEKAGGLKQYDFDLDRVKAPLIFEESHVQDPELILDKHIVEADALGLARAREFGRLLLDCVDELPLREDV